MELIEVRHSGRARRWRLVVPWGESAVLTVPEGTSSQEIERVLQERHDWIARQRERQRPRLELDPLAVSETHSRIRARELVSEIADREAAMLAVNYNRIRIGAQRTLWGSCSPSGTLSFNWKLVLAPFDVLDYVVVHELCHLRVRNHSRRFWSTVEQRRPQWRQQRDWLRDHGAELLAFRASA
jgi:predicted metal-dependent hydrolase